MELGTVVAQEFIDLNVEAELILREMTKNDP
jgi:hypothetical protein